MRLTRRNGRTSEAAPTAALEPSATLIQPQRLTLIHILVLAVAVLVFAVITQCSLKLSPYRGFLARKIIPPIGQLEMIANTSRVQTMIVVRVEHACGRIQHELSQIVDWTFNDSALVGMLRLLRVHVEGGLRNDQFGSEADLFRQQHFSPSAEVEESVFRTRAIVTSLFRKFWKIINRINSSWSFRDQPECRSAHVDIRSVARSARIFNPNIVFASLAVDFFLPDIASKVSFKNWWLDYLNVRLVFCGKLPITLNMIPNVDRRYCDGRGRNQSSTQPSYPSTPASTFNVSPYAPFLAIAGYLGTIVSFALIFCGLECSSSRRDLLLCGIFLIVALVVFHIGLFSL
jgi:hypothetical protein